MNPLTEPSFWEAVAPQVPALVLFAGSFIYILKLVFAHLTTEGADTRKVTRALASDIRDNTEATRAVTTAIRESRMITGD